MPEHEKSDAEIVAEYQSKWQQVLAFWKPFIEQIGKKEFADKIEAVYARAAREIPADQQIKFWPHVVHWLYEDMAKFQNASEEDKRKYVEGLERGTRGIESMLEHFKQK